MNAICLGLVLLSRFILCFYSSFNNIRYLKMHNNRGQRKFVEILQHNVTTQFFQQIPGL